MEYDLIFAVMAVREVVFFGKIACRLRDEFGLKIAFLLFHEAGDTLLDEMEIDHFKFYKLACQIHTQATPEEIDDVLKTCNLNKLEDLYRHEMLTTNRLDTKLMSRKVVRYFKAMDKFLNEHKIRCIVQELGGFIAPQVLYHASQKSNINHIFIEPALYKQRVAFTLNTLYADISCYDEREEFSPRIVEFVNSYLDTALKQKPVVVPYKDKLFFQDMNLKRLLAPVNFQKLGRKLYHKYILRKHEEYNAILWYVTFHVIKLFTRKLLSSYYSKLDVSQKYIYFPFHVPLDVQITVRCPEYLDQLALIEKIARYLPDDYNLYVKEHPASIGAYSFNRLRDILAKNDNIRLIDPATNSFDIVKNARAIITINSKVGIEALIQSKPVIVIGKCFYKHKGVTFDVENLSDLKEIIPQVVESKVDSDRVRRLFLKTYRWSYGGELYENSPENVENFYNSLRVFILKSGLKFITE